MTDKTPPSASQADTFDLSRVAWVSDKDDLRHLLSALQDAPAVVYDLETTGLDEHAVTHGPSNGGVAARIVLASFTLPRYTDHGEVDGEPTTYLVALSHPESPWMGKWQRVSRLLAGAMKRGRGVIVGHNIKYDHRWIYACTRIPGVPAGQPVFDKEDEDLFKKGHISNTGYWRIYIPGGPTSGVAAHDLIAERFLGPKPEGYSVDHWNRDPLDNRRANLRYVTRAEQMQNRENWGASGVRGAYLKKSGRYEAALTIQGKRKYLGTFATAEEAGAAVDAFQQRADQKPPRSVREVPGVDLSHRPLWDTQISSHLLDENSLTRLKVRAPDTFGIDRWDDVDLTYPGAAEDEPLFKLGEYAARDTYWTWKLYENHRARMLPDAGEDLFGEEIEEARLGQLAQYVAMPTTATLTAIEQRGLRLDVPWVEERIRELEEEHDRLFADLTSRYESEELAGASPSFAPTSKWFQEWARIAEERDDLRVLALTPSGKPQWSKQVLKKLARQGFETAESMLQLRAASKQLEFLRAWLEMVTPEGRIHTTYNAGSVRTGRLSSSGPNMQQVTYALRPAFVPTEGHYLVDLDYSQIELRVAAFISQSVPMIEAFKQEMDLHLMISGRTNSDKAIQAASLYLVHLGLPPNRTGAEVLLRLRGGQGDRGLPAKVAALLRETHRSGAGEESGSRERWCAERGAESPVEGRDQPGAVSKVSEDLVREVRSYCERWGWPWERDADDAGRAPSESRQIGQPSIELDDAVQVVSSASASILSDLTGEDWAMLRQQGKAQNFGLIYGMGVAGFKDYAEDVYGVHFSDQEAAVVHETFFEMWDGIRQWHLRSMKRAHDVGQVVSPIGRVRRLPDIWDGNEQVVGHAERNSVNSPVQGFASDIMQIAAACIEGNVHGVPAIPDVRLVGTVHDSILVEVRADRWEEAALACKRVMEEEVPLVLEKMGCVFDIPLVADFSVGTRWGVSDVGEG